jgi:hypothetical protein
MSDRSSAPPPRGVRPSAQEKQLLWRKRMYLAGQMAETLPAFLLSVDYFNPEMVAEVGHRIHTQVIWSALYAAPSHLAWVVCRTKSFGMPQVPAFLRSVDYFNPEMVAEVGHPVPCMPHQVIGVH